ncbi:protein pinocchio-like isoform X2 [Rhipicephalus microplus]|uniref:protein pinocchio-like isoform X2 n=1 Tax=Rhipicephalus microplus TaxID=6941 RepID=UPI003F6AF744
MYASSHHEKELVMWRTKSDPMIVALSHNSMASCWDNEKRWDNIEHLAEQKVPTQWTDAITLEGLKSLYNCCFTCGVSWAEGQASLDCAECGGYALHRPCVHCDGSCGRVWRRDLVASHQLRRSQWIGKCEKSLRGPAIGKSRDFFP